MVEPGRSLTRQEFDAVIRRAAELAQSDPEAADGDLSEADLYRIAGDVGLGEGHVRRALAEVRSGASPGGSGLLDRLFGAATVHASRVVPGRPDELRESIDEFFVASQLLEPVRRAPGMLQYRPAVDWASKLAQAASLRSKKHYVASARRVDVRLDRVDDERTLVALTVDPGTRGEQLAGAGIGGGSAGVGLGVGATILLTPAWPLAAAVAGGVILGSIVSSGIAVAVGRGHRRRLTEVEAEVEGILDLLEAGEPLEPPPPSWRRWVRRQFHGVARDLER